MYKNNAGKQYVAYGGSCGDEDPVPCYFYPSQLKQFCFSPCFTNYNRTRAVFYFLLAHPNLEWVQTNRIQMLSIPNTLKLNGTYQFLFGRIFQHGEYTFGKVYTTSRRLGFWNSPRSENSPIPFEVLRCRPDKEKITTSTTMSSQTLDQFNCGLLKNNLI